VLVDTIGESPILSLIDRIFELRREGQEILGLHIGEPDFETPAGIQQAAVEAMKAGLTHYVSAQGMPDLREAIAQRARARHRIPATAEDVVVLPAKFAIYASLLCTVGAGDEVLLPDPTYLFDQPIRLVGARPTYFPLREDFSFDVEAISGAIGPRSRILVLVSPGNPTGRLMTRAEVTAAIQVARDHHLTILSDETYESLIYEGHHVAPAAEAGDDVPVLTIGSFSKMFAMTGWRIGFVIAPPEIRRRLVKVMEHTLTCLPPFIERAALWGLEHAEADVTRFREIFRARRDRLLELLSEVPGLSIVRPHGAFYVFPRYDRPVDSIRFCRDLLERERLALVPGIAFGSRGEGHFRISYSSPVEALEEGVRRLSRYMQSSV
jgi:aspartate aminotransferase